MHRLIALGSIAALAMIGAGAQAAKQPGATAMVMTPGGAMIGTAKLSQTTAGIHILLDAAGLPPGGHGVHLHMTGLCEGPDYKTAGGHWNPTHMAHGKDATGGPHMGDLPNMTVGADGKGHLDATVAGGKIAGGPMPLLDADGAALVIHASADDYKTDPSGNSGGRIACGVVKAD